MENARKIFILVPPSSGHMNPVICIARKLVESNRMHVIFYGSTKFKGMIEKTGATYREYQADNELYNPKAGLKETANSLGVYLGHWLEFADQVMPQLIEDAERDQPDLILYDLLALHAKFLRKCLDNRFAKNLTSTKPPELVEISSAFAFLPGVFPSSEQMKLFTRDQNKWFALVFLGLIVQQARFSYKYGVDVLNPLKFFFGKDFQTITLTTVFPQFQPKRELFDSTIFKFVGSCIDEECRNHQMAVDPKLQQILDEFPPVNPLKLPVDLSATKKRLVYVSLGTVFNDNKFIYDKIIGGINKYQREHGKCELRVVFSLGEGVLREYEEEGFKMPENFVFQKSVPQIEVLKRASLFITHCGMNSCSESLHYGVPIIGIPLGAEQPINAIRMCDELGVGIQFENPFTLQEDKIGQAINKIMSDESFLIEVCKLSEKSREYDGSSGACQEIIKFFESRQQ